LKIADFDWDNVKDAENRKKHGIAFDTAQRAVSDPKRVIAHDVKHSTVNERRFFCYGLVDGQIMTVRFTVRHGILRIFGAGYWREGRRRYHEKNNLH
jgi:uncharacterized DUF497 family protein